MSNLRRCISALFGGLIRELGQFFVCLLLRFRHIHKPRCCNEVAHALAELRCLWPVDVSLSFEVFDDMPHCIQLMVASVSAAPFG